MSPRTGLTCGIDIGGTKIAGAVVDERGEVLAEHRIDSPATDPEAIEETVAVLVQRLAEDHEITAVGVGAAGFVDAAPSRRCGWKCRGTGHCSGTAWPCS